MKTLCLRFLPLFLLLPASAAAQEGNVRKIANVRYAETKDVDAARQSLDLYIPANAKNAPIVLYIHGGGWSKGDKAGIPKSQVEYFTRNGYLLASANYRLSPAALHPAHVEDVAAAVAYLHKNAKNHGGDGEKIILIGHSAGAHLVAVVGTNEKLLKTHGLTLKILQGVIPVDVGAFDLLKRKNEAPDKMLKMPFGSTDEIFKDASPVTHVAAGKNIPSFLILSSPGLKDSKTQSEHFAETLTKAGVYARVAHLADKNHGTVNSDIGKEGDETTRLLTEFLQRVKSKQP